MHTTPTTLAVRSSGVPGLLGANPAGIWYSMSKPFTLVTWISYLEKVPFRLLVDHYATDSGDLRSICARGEMNIEFFSIAAMRFSS